MSIKELVDDLISEENSIITAPSGNGSTVLLLNIINYLVSKDKVILYYGKDIDREYIKLNFPRVYENVIFIEEAFNNSKSKIENIVVCFYDKDAYAKIYDGDNNIVEIITNYSLCDITDTKHFMVVKK